MTWGPPIASEQVVQKSLPEKERKCGNEYKKALSDVTSLVNFQYWALTCHAFIMARI